MDIEKHLELIHEELTDMHKRVKSIDASITGIVKAYQQHTSRITALERGSMPAPKTAHPSKRRRIKTGT